MLAKLGMLIAGWVSRVVPEPFVLAVLLTVVAAGLSIFAGFVPSMPFGERSLAVLDAWRASDGLWRWLAFGMQMCLVLVTGHAVASSRPVRRLLDGLASLPRSGRSAVVLVAGCAMAAGLLNWGLGLIVGALLARDVCRACWSRGVRVHAPLLAAAGYTGMLVWHGGLSGSAPLSVSTRDGASKVLPAEALALLPEGGISLGHTLASPLNLVVTGGLVLLTLVVLAMLHPGGEQSKPSPLEDGLEKLVSCQSPHPGSGLHHVLEHTRLVPWTLGVLLAIAVMRYAMVDGLASVGLNEINAAMLALALLLHGSTRSFIDAVEEGARACAGVIVQFPLYAGIMAMLSVSGLLVAWSGAVAGIGGPGATQVVTFLSAGVVNLFVPSGGGQWGIQGPIALESGFAAGVEPGRMVMAVAYGDQLTNMLQPFWALPLLAITRIPAKDIVGYTAVLMVVAGLWITLGLLLV